MRPWEAFFNLYALLVLGYFAVLYLFYALLGYLGLRTIVSHGQQNSPLALKDMLAQGSFKGMSILVPARDEEAVIVASVRAYLSLDYPEYEVIVISDGSLDNTVATLADTFDVVEAFADDRPRLGTAKVERVYRSSRYPRLTVIDKAAGGKADALNAGLNLARYPLVCAVDADSRLDAKALLQASRRFAEDERLIAVGGTIRPLSRGALSGKTALGNGGRLPRSWLERLQVVEYARALLMDRLGWSALNALPIISGAFGLFSRQAVMEVGGYRVGTVGEDMELVMRLHKRFSGAWPRTDRRMLFMPEPVCWTLVPVTRQALRRQRNRWQRGLIEALWLHKDMLFRRRYGRLGMVVLPYFWVFEALAPVVEMLAYGLFAASLLSGLFFPGFTLLFLLVALVCGTLVSQLAVGVETLFFGRYATRRERLTLFGATFLEALGYRQMLMLERFVAIFQVLAKRGQW